MIKENRISQVKGAYGELLVNLLTKKFQQWHRFGHLRTLLMKSFVDRLDGKAEAGKKLDEAVCDRLGDVGDNEIGVQDFRTREHERHQRSK